MSLEIFQLTKDVIDEWNDFCLKSNSAWFRHTTFFLEYILHCRFDRLSRNLSFGIKQNNKIVAVAPLILQTNYEDKDIFEFGLGDTPIPFPAFDNSLFPENKKEITKVIFEKIDELAKQNNISYAKFFVDPLTDDILLGTHITNPLPKFGYHETSISTNIIVLNKPIEEIFKDIRKGHKADIKNAIKNKFVVDFFSKENIKKEIFNIYKELHYLASGRKTRPDESWEDMFGFIKNGYSILALERKQDKQEYFAGVLVITYKGKAYYGSGATHPKYEGVRGIGHLLHWQIITYLKDNGYNYYETGWNYYPIISQEVATDKELNISRFKSGFGGELYPLFRGEKFYNKEYLKNKKLTLIDSFINLYLK